MSGLGEYAQKAEQYAKDHPDQVDKGVQRGEKSVEQDTDHRFDQQVGEGGEQVVVHRNVPQRAAERARVVDIADDSRLRVEFPDGFRSTCDLDQVSPIDAPKA